MHSPGAFDTRGVAEYGQAYANFGIDKCAVCVH